MVSQISKIWLLVNLHLVLLSLGSEFGGGNGALAMNLGVPKAPAMTMTMLEIGDMQLKIRQAPSPAPTSQAPTATNTNGGDAATTDGSGATLSSSAAKSAVSASISKTASSTTEANLFCSTGSYICPSSVGYGCCPLGLQCRATDCVGFVTSGAGALPTSQDVTFAQPTALARGTPLFTTIPQKKGLSKGAIGGIAAGAAIGAILVIVGLVLAILWWKKHKKRENNPYPTPHPSTHQYYPSHTVNAPSTMAGGAVGAATAGGTSSGTGGTQTSHRRNQSSQGSGTYSATTSVAGYYNKQPSAKRQHSQTRSISQMSQGEYGPPQQPYPQHGYGAVSPQTPGSMGTPAAGAPGGGVTYTTYDHPQFSRSISNTDSFQGRPGAVSPGISPANMPGSPGSLSSGSMSLSHVRSLSNETMEYNPPVASWPAGYNPPVASEPVFEVEGSTPHHLKSQDEKAP